MRRVGRRDGGGTGEVGEKEDGGGTEAETQRRSPPSWVGLRDIEPITACIFFDTN